MKPGTIVKLPDGRVATVVYHGLDGHGIRWGKIEVDLDVIYGANPLFGTRPEEYPYDPEAVKLDCNFRTRYASHVLTRAAARNSVVIADSDGAYSAINVWKHSRKEFQT